MTRRYALLGDPITHSPSPAMHNAGFLALGIDAAYELCPTRPEELHDRFVELRAGRFAGYNITTPLKTHAVTQCDHISQIAARAEAINTVWCENGIVHGDLTDVRGVAQPLEELLGTRSAQTTQDLSKSHRLPCGNADLSEGRPASARMTSEGHQRALLLGAGGAARAALLALENLGFIVDCAARQSPAAQQVLDLNNPLHRGNAYALDAREVLKTHWPEYQVIVQATPVGRQGEAHDLPWELTPHRDLIAFEMLYLPRTTPFLRSAEASGARLIYGWEMLLAQGAESFAQWTGQVAPLKAMTTALQAHLEHAEGSVVRA